MDALVVSAIPEGIELVVLDLPEFAELVRLQCGDDPTEVQKAACLDALLQILFEHISETNAAIVRQAIAEARSRIESQVGCLEAELATTKTQRDQALARAKQFEQRCVQLERLFAAIDVPKDLVTKVHRAARDFNTPADVLHQVLGEASGMLEGIRSTLRPLRSTGS